MVGESKRQKTVAVVECGCDEHVLATWPDYKDVATTSTCACTSRRLGEEILRHHYQARRDAAGRSPPDLKAVNRFCAYGALNAIVNKNKKGAYIFVCHLKLPPLPSVGYHSMRGLLS